MLLTEQDQEQLSLMFRAIYEAEEKIDQLKDNTKAFTKHMRETIKNISQKIEVPQKVVKAAYKEYRNNIENPEEEQAKNEVLAILETYNLLKK